jgi:hypothetical protein
MRADTFYGIHDRPTKIPADCSKIRCAFPRALRLGLRTADAIRNVVWVGLKRRFAMAPIPLRYARGAPLRRSHRYHVPQPLDPRGIECVQQYRVEAARRSLPQSREIKTCSGGHPCALCCSDARGGAPEVVAPPQPHFDEHEHIAITGDEIELADAAAPVALDDNEPMANEV